MLSVPNDAIAIEIGLLRNEAMANAQAWTSEVIRLGGLAWDYCALRDWSALELTFGGSITIAPDDDEDAGQVVEPGES